MNEKEFLEQLNSLIEKYINSNDGSHVSFIFKVTNDNRGFDFSFIDCKSCMEKLNFVMERRKVELFLADALEGKGNKNIKAVDIKRNKNIEDTKNTGYIG